MDDRYIGPGFGRASAEGDAAMRLALACEGLILDPVYTAKALAGLEGMLAGANMAGSSLVLLHTGGEPGLYASHRLYGAPGVPHTESVDA